MNGNWNAYGIQPLRYVQVWQEMYAVVKSIAPQVAMVWAPNTGQGYPYSMPLPTNQTEANAMDTNGDGQLTYLDVSTRTVPNSAMCMADVTRA